MENKLEEMALKIKDGAYAVYDFFEALKSDKNCSPEELEDELSGKYDLTEQQRSYLRQIRKRASGAKRIIKSVEDKFGIDESGKINKPNDAYCLAFGGKVMDIEEARSYNVAIGFHKKTWKARTYLGRTTTKARDSKNPYNEIAESLENGREPNFEDLAFIAPCLDKCERVVGPERINRERIFMSIRGKAYQPAPEVLLDTIIKHEQRHIFDNIMHNSFYFLRETAAVLYSEKKLDGIDTDIERVTETYAPQLKEKYKLEFEKIRALISQVPEKNLGAFSYVLTYYYANVGKHLRGIKITDFLSIAVPAWMDKTNTSE